jgi:Tfp pilus assembly protein PilF
MSLVPPQSGRRISDRQTADVQVALGRTYEQHGQFDLARTAYAEAVKHDPKRTDAYVRLAILHDRQGKFKESAELYRKALQTAPGNPDIFCDMGYSMYLQRRWAEAEMNLQQALVLKPDHARAHNNLGLVLTHTDRVEEALAHFRKAGTEAQAHLNLAVALMLDERWDDARAQYEQALSADPSLEQAKKGLQELDMLLAKISPPQSVPLAPTAASAPAIVQASLTEPADASSPSAEQVTRVAKIQLDNRPPEAPEEPERLQPPALDLAPEVLPAKPATDAEPTLLISQARTLFRMQTPAP